MDLGLCNGLSVTGQTFHLQQMLSGAAVFMWPLQGKRLNRITCSHSVAEGAPNGASCFGSQKKSQGEARSGLLSKLKVKVFFFSFLFFVSIYP